MHTRTWKLMAIFAATALVGLGLPPSVNAATAPIKKITVGGMPTGTVTNDNVAYVSNQSLGQLHIIDISAAKLVKTLDICPVPSPPATSPDGTKVFVSCGDNTVRIVSTTSNTEIAKIPVGTGPGKPVASNAFAYVSNVSSNDVSVIDTATGTVVATVAVGLNPTTGVFGTGNQYDSFNNNLYVPNRNAGSISVISTSSNTLIATIPGQPQISEAAVAPIFSSVGPLLFASKINASELVVSNQDPANASTTGSTIPVGDNPGKPAVNIDGTRVYVANYSGKSVSVVNVDTNKVIATVPVGVQPGDPVVDGSGSSVYVPNFGSSTVTAISTKTNAVRATYFVGKGPMGVSLTSDGVTLVVSNSNDGTISLVKIAASAFPKAPKKVTVSTATSKQGKVTWKKSTSSGVTGYVVTALPGGKTCTTTKTTCTIKKLTGGVKYTFAVQAKSKYGAGAPGNSKLTTVKK